jgi:glutamine synthetase
LAKFHKECIFLYGDGNELRLTGTHETSSMHEFNWKVRSRGASVRVPVYTEQLGYGYFEDRRPASNIDPYLVSGAIVDAVCNDGKHINELCEILTISKENKF